jgi:hypothetical protein
MHIYIYIYIYIYKLFSMSNVCNQITNRVRKHGFAVQWLGKTMHSLPLEVKGTAISGVGGGNK